MAILSCVAQKAASAAQGRCYQQLCILFEDQTIKTL
jgi:hypothetical protein